MSAKRFSTPYLATGTHFVLIVGLPSTGTKMSSDVPALSKYNPSPAYKPHVQSIGHSPFEHFPFLHCKAYVSIVDLGSARIHAAYFVTALPTIPGIR